jgi:hypothetical protein
MGSLAWLAIILPAQAAFDERYKLSIGTNIARFNSNITINSQDGSIDSDINFEEDAGFDSDIRTNWISGWYRVGDNHRLNLTYIPIHRSGFRQTDKDIIVDNTTIKAGAVVAGEINNNIFDLSYIYSAYKRPNLEVGLSAGLYWLDTDFEILAAGEIQAEGDDTPVFKSDYESSQKLQAPLPLIGIRADYEITPSWRTQAAFRYLSVNIDNLEGEVFTVEIGTEYYFNRNWGLGASLAYVDLNVDTNGVLLTNSLGWAQNGIQIYGVFKY